MSCRLDKSIILRLEYILQEVFIEEMQFFKDDAIIEEMKDIREMSWSLLRKLFCHLRFASDAMRALQTLLSLQAKKAGKTRLAGLEHNNPPRAKATRVVLFVTRPPTFSNLQLWQEWGDDEGRTLYHYITYQWRNEYSRRMTPSKSFLLCI